MFRETLSSKPHQHSSHQLHDVSVWGEASGGCLFARPADPCTRRSSSRPTPEEELWDAAWSTSYGVIEGWFDRGGLVW